jgi:hypothetical protein
VTSPSLCQPTWTSILSYPPFDRGCLQRPLARCFMPLSASSITPTSIPFLTSPDLAVQHVQGGGLHTRNSVGELVYLHCARSSIRNTVPTLFPCRYLDCSFDPWTGDIVRIAPNEVIICTSRLTNRDSLPSSFTAPLCKTDGVRRNLHFQEQMGQGLWTLPGFRHGRSHPYADGLP